MTPTQTENLSKKLILDHRICSHEVNLNQQMSIPTLMGMLQEVAYRHAEERGWGWGTLSPKNHFWVLMRLHIEFDHFPMWNDEIRIETWATGTNGLFAKRSWDILDKEGKSLIRCSSDWVVIDGASRRIQRIDPESFKNWYLSDPKTIQDPLKLRPLGSKKLVGEYPIRLSEIDLMQHVNNANYVKWVLDTIEIDFVNSHEPAKLEVNFLKEAKFPQLIQVYKESREPLTSDFSLVSKSDETEHVRVRIDWKKKGS